MQRITKALLGLAVLNGLVFAALEVGARLWLRYYASDEQFYIYASLSQLEGRGDRFHDVTPKYALHRYIGYYPNPNHRYRQNRHNALGFRGDEIVLPKPPDEFRIVCMGGSATYSGHINDYKLSFPYLLETKLRERGYNVTVVNAAAEAYASYETLLTFQLRVLDIDPDLVIVYHAVNDAIQRMVWPPDVYRGDNSGSRGPVVSSLYMPGIWEYSTFIRIRLIRGGLARPHSDPPTFYDVHEPTFYGFTWRDQRLENAQPTGVLQQVTARNMLESNPPTFFRRNLESLAATANHFGITTVFASFAHNPEFEDEPLVSDPEFNWTYAEMNTVVEEVAANTGSAFFDFANTFPTEARYFTDGIHMNEAGAQLAAETFAQYLTDNQLIPPAYQQAAPAS